MKQILNKILFILIATFILCFGFTEIAYGVFNYRELYISPTGIKRVVVFIDGNIQSVLVPSLEFQEWKNDLETEGYKIILTEVTSGVAEDLRNYLIQKYSSGGLDGVIVTGDLPYASFENSQFGYQSFPTDYFYMDLNGIWLDQDNNGIYETHNGHRKPEIWIGRLKTSNLVFDTSRDEVGKLRYYFRKNHEYRHGRLSSNNKALLFKDNDFISDIDYWISILQSGFGNNLDVVSDNNLTTANYYMQKLWQNYLWVDVTVHSGPGLHAFDKTDNFLSTDLVSNNPNSLFYWLNACSNARFTSSEYMAGNYIINRTHGLAAVGSTSIMGLRNERPFYSAINIGNRKTIGEGLKEWFSSFPLDDEKWEGYKQYQTSYGMVLIGDPTLRPFSLSVGKLGWNKYLSSDSLSNFDHAKCPMYSYKRGLFNASVNNYSVFSSALLNNTLFVLCK